MTWGGDPRRAADEARTWAGDPRRASGDVTRGAGDARARTGGVAMSRRVVAERERDPLRAVEGAVVELP